jgi:preprotein translocase subunit SecY
MGLIENIGSKLPGIADPKGFVSFKTRLKWTSLILLLFLVLGQITLYGVSPTERARLQFFELILGSSIGSLITLGIGPIVTASIILQLLVGSKIIGWDLKTPEGRKKFQGTQKVLTIIFAVFEAIAFVSFGAIQPASGDAGIFTFLILQLALGAILLMLMDEVTNKYGIGSGVSLFIAAGVAKQIFVRALNPLPPPGDTVPAGLIPQSVVFFGSGEIATAIISLLPVIATLIVFAIVVYVQALKVDIPLAFGSIRGFGRRWPLKLIYTSNIPVILVAALLANIQLVGSMMAKPTEFGSRCGFLGCFDSQGIPISGAVLFLQAPTALQIQVFFLIFLAIAFAAGMIAFILKFKNALRFISISMIVAFILAAAITYATVQLPTTIDIFRALTYFFVLVIGATIFSIFWVSTSGMDSKSVAEQIEGMGFQVPGFRRDPRIVEQVLERYIPVLAIISGIFIGALAALADFTGALGTGTGILLTVMIIYNFYEQISQRYVEEMNPAVRKFFS